MNIHYKLKNFRVFGEKGAEIDIAPITILTGCNSSGKSSITKSLLLLGNFCEMLYKSKMLNSFSRIDFSKAKIDFRQLNNLSLGSFDKVINANNKDGIISFEYRMHSHYISNDIIVKLDFSSDKSDNSNNGYLKGYTITDKNDNILFKSEVHGLHYDNLNLLLLSFYDFYYYYLLRKKLADFRSLNRKDASCKKKLSEIQDEIDYFLRDKSKSLNQDLAYCQHNGKIMNSSDRSIFDENAVEPLNKLKEVGTLFYLNHWDWFKSLTPENIKQEIKSKVEIKGTEEKLNELINIVVNDFISSGEENFINYYLKKEAIFLEEKLLSDDDDFEIRSYNAVFLPQEFCDDEDEDEVIYLPDGTEVKIKRSLGNEEGKEVKIADVTFDNVYQMAVTIDYFMGNANEEYYYPLSGKKLKFQHILFTPFNKFAKCISDEALSPLFLHDIRYISTSRVTVQRIYTYQSNEFSKLIEEYNENKRNRNFYSRRVYDNDIFINKWIKAFGLGENIEMENDEEGIGTKIKINKGDCVRLLADEGYGVTQLVSILLQIEVAIQKNIFSSRFPTLRFINEDDRGSFREQNIIIEEPEIHLHPKYQSLLADMITDAYINYNIHFIVETHSEYLIRRLQNIIGDFQNILQPKDISINYVYSKDDPDNNGNRPIKGINIQSDGRLVDSFGKGFFDEADRQVEDLVNRKVERHGRFSKK